jgi:hypothetical protein
MFRHSLFLLAAVACLATAPAMAAAADRTVITLSTLGLVLLAVLLIILLT